MSLVQTSMIRKGISINVHDTPWHCHVPTSMHLCLPALKREDFHSRLCLNAAVFVYGATKSRDTVLLFVRQLLQVLPF